MNGNREGSIKSHYIRRTLAEVKNKKPNLEREYYFSAKNIGVNGFVTKSDFIASYLDKLTDDSDLYFKDSLFQLGEEVFSIERNLLQKTKMPISYFLFGEVSVWERSKECNSILGDTVDCKHSISPSFPSKKEERLYNKIKGFALEKDCVESPLKFEIKDSFLMETLSNSKMILSPWARNFYSFKEIVEILIETVGKIHCVPLRRRDELKFILSLLKEIEDYVEAVLIENLSKPEIKREGKGLRSYEIAFENEFQDDNNLERKVIEKVRFDCYTDLGLGLYFAAVTKNLLKGSAIEKSIEERLKGNIPYEIDELTSEIFRKISSYSKESYPLR